VSTTGDATLANGTPVRGGGAWIALSAVIVALDQLSKWYVSAHLEFAVPYPVLPVLDFTLLHNTGAAFSFLAGQAGWQRWVFTALALGVSALIIGWLYRLPRSQAWTCTALACVLGGALGNVIDRMRLGYVVDFVHVHYKAFDWPAFNVADSAISVGAVMLGLEILFGARRPAD
jgi:signal peptidase II